MVRELHDHGKSEDVLHATKKRLEWLFMITTTMARRALLCATFVLALAASSPAATANKSATKSKTTATLIDVNHATRARLVALPEIGERYAAKIIAGRPYLRKDQLVTKNILPKATDDKIASRLIAKQ